MSEAAFERGRLGRVAAIRLRPNEDLVEGVEAVCAEHGVAHAVVRSGVGSLVDAELGYGRGEGAGGVRIEGPGVEILTLAGEVRPSGDGRPRAELRGTISDPNGRVHAGAFVRGGNPICITLELVLQEWLPDAQGAPSPAGTAASEEV